MKPIHYAVTYQLEELNGNKVTTSRDYHAADEAALNHQVAVFTKEAKAMVKSVDVLWIEILTNEQQDEK